MRTFFYILLIVFVTSTVYAAKNDLRSLYIKLESKFEFIDKGGIKLPTFANNFLKNITNIQDPLTPGPLILKDQIENPININLTIQGIISKTNSQRSAISLKSLSENRDLDNSASKKVDDMFEKQYFEHTSPEGIGVSDLASDGGYDYILIGENLALGDFRNDGDVVSAWMASPGHKANILNNRYTEIGVAVKKGIYLGDEVWIAVQHFGMPMDICGGIDQKLKVEIDSNQLELKSLESDLTLKKAEIDAVGQSNQTLYQSLVQEYNLTVGEYNRIVEIIESDINTYNAEVAIFNTCVKGE